MGRFEKNAMDKQVYINTIAIRKRLPERGKNVRNINSVENTSLVLKEVQSML